MATRDNLMAFGLTYPLANEIGITPVITSISGATAAAASVIGGQQFLTMITASNSGSALRLPNVTGDTGCLLGDEFRIMNAFGSNLQVFANNNSLGSAVTIYINGQSLAGTTGFSIAAGYMAIVYPITVSTWVGIKSSA